MNAAKEEDELQEEEEDPNLEFDLYQAKYMRKRCKADPDGFGKDLYSALCNQTWKHKETGVAYSCSWRYAGGIASSLAYGVDDHMMYYSSGNEGTVTDEVLTELDKLGWLPTEDEDDQDTGSSP